MNIGIDARSLVEKKTGIGYYLQNLLINILKKDLTNKYYLISDRKIEFNIKHFDNVFKIQGKGFLKKTLWYLFNVKNLARENNLEIFWGTQHILPINLDENIKTLLTVHDLVFCVMPDTMGKYNRFIMKTFCPISIKKSTRIVVDSYSTLNGIKKYFGRKISKKRIDVVYLAAEAFTANEEQNKKFNDKYRNLPFIERGNYLLYVGTIEPRKNIETLLTAYEMIQESIDLKLVICGKIGWKCDTILNIIKHNKDITYLNYVTNEDKFIFMKKAFAFVYPSKYEGFGLPVVEAMKMGTVTLTTRSSSLDELIEKDELKFSANNPIELKNKILMLHQDHKLYEECEKYCTKRGDDFSWEKAADEYIKIFENLNK